MRRFNRRPLTSLGLFRRHPPQTPHPGRPVQIPALAMRPASPLRPAGRHGQNRSPRPIPRKTSRPVHQRLYSRLPLRHVAHLAQRRPGVTWIIQTPAVAWGSPIPHPGQTQLEVHRLPRLGRRHRAEVAPNPHGQSRAGPIRVNHHLCSTISDRIRNRNRPSPGRRHGPNSDPASPCRLTLRTRRPPSASKSTSAVGRRSPHRC